MKKNNIIRHFNKKTNITYLYWGHSVYMPDQDYPKVEKKCIGKIDNKGEFEPNKTFLSLSPTEQLETGLVDEPFMALYTRGDKETYESKMFGFTALLETAAKESGVWLSLKKIFPTDWQQQLSIVEAMMSYPDRPLYSPKHFHDVCWHTMVDSPTEYSITKALEAVDPESMERFFGDFERRTELKRKERNPLEDMVVVALDTTSISTFSAMLEAAKFGKNKEGDVLAQINLLMICDDVTGIPLYFRSLPGNYSDKNVLDVTIKELKSAEFRKGTILLMDRGFYSLANIKMLLKSDFRFIVGMPLTTEYYKDAIREAYDVILDNENYYKSIGMHAWTKTIIFDAPRRGRGLNQHETALYLFHDAQKQAEDQQRLTRSFTKKKEMLESDRNLYKKANSYGKYYTIEYDGDGEFIRVADNKEAQRDKMKECGFFGFLGPTGLSPERVLSLVRNRDYIEKDYECYKSKMRRPKHSLEEHLEGKIFLVYLTTILEMWIRRKMNEYLLFDKYSFNNLRDEIFSAKWRKPKGKTFNKGQWCELPLETQKLFYIFGILKAKDLRDDIPKMVERELKKKQLKHGLSVD
ncbi:MAG: hypothetical protein EOM67_13110 [Spirochaetia bacterium]|nr:hypothetical protein [Spirochaetia bacterium]